MALGLVHLFHVEHGVESPRAADVRAHLESPGRGGLVDLLLELAAASPEVRDRLEIRAAAGTCGSGGGVGVAHCAP